MGFCFFFLESYNEGGEGINRRVEKLDDEHVVEPITLQTGLAAGIADPIISSLLAPGNDAFNTALQVLRARNLAGRFWSL